MEDYKEQLKIAIERLQERGKDWVKKDWVRQAKELEEDLESFSEQIYLFGVQRDANLRNDKPNKFNPKFVYEFEYKDKFYRKAILQLRLKQIDKEINIAKNNYQITLEKIKYCNLQAKKK
ncbi:MAG: hypothetical protein EOL97_09655 [Spirochaetia bacterium]|nr:hypothetical protein [Spirochaetia bacterium]